MIGKNDWYVISDDYFQIELLGYENSKKVKFYIERMESDEERALMYTDNDNSDGWIYTNHQIGEIIDRQKKPLSRGGFSYGPYFVIYGEVTSEDGSIIKTPKLPIYNH